MHSRPRFHPSWSPSTFTTLPPRRPTRVSQPEPQKRHTLLCQESTGMASSRVQPMHPGPARPAAATPK